MVLNYMKLCNILWDVDQCPPAMVKAPRKQPPLALITANARDRCCSCPLHGPRG